MQITARELAATFPARQRALAHPVPARWITLAARLAADLARDRAKAVAWSFVRSIDYWL
jgi:hypothetical protein